MKRIALMLLVCAAFVVAPRGLLAQDENAAPQATPSDWMVYDDPAMHFHAPDGWQPVGQRQIPLKLLKDDPSIVAGWIFTDKNHPRRLVIQQEYFQGDANGYQAEYESQLRDQFDTPLFKNKEHIALKNGMPAIFEEMTTGEGFNVQKFYLLMWADGQRGVTILMQTQINDIDGSAARRLMSDVSAVRYPMNRGDT